MDEWIGSVLGILIAGAIGLLGMFLGRRSQTARIAELKRLRVESEVKNANIQIKDIERTTETAVVEIEKQEDHIDNIDAGNLADEFNGEFK